MVYDLAMLKAFYTLCEGKIERIRTILQRPLTLAEKILYSHLYDEKNVKDYKRGEDYVNFRPDRSPPHDLQLPGEQLGPDHGRPCHDGQDVLSAGRGWRTIRTERDGMEKSIPSLFFG